MPNPNLIQEREEEFDKEFPELVKMTDGMTYRNVAPKDKVKSFNKQTLHLLLSDIIERIEEDKIEKVTFPQGANMDMPYNQMLLGYSEALDNSIAIIKEYLAKNK